jgi:hypothetical protein
MHLGDVADLIGPNHFRTLTGAFVRITLVAHLRGHLVLRRCFSQLAALPHGMRQRLLDVDVFAPLHGPDGGRGVHKIGDGDDDRVDVVVFLVEHDPEILVARSRLELLIDSRGAIVVDVA